MRNVSVFGLSASRGSDAVRHCEVTIKGNVHRAMPKDEAPGHEGAKANYKTIGK